MENAVDALKIAFAIFVFVIALSLAMSTIGRARATSDVVFHVNDKTEFMDYVTEEDVNTEDRIVGMETIIPTIHRYAKEQFAVSIFDTDGNPIVRYDLWTEGIMPNWNLVLKNLTKEDSKKDTGLTATYLEVQNRLGRIQDIVNVTLNKGRNENFDVKSTINQYYSVVSGNKDITYRSTLDWR